METIRRKIAPYWSWSDRNRRHDLLERFWKEARDLLDHDRESFKERFSEPCDYLQCAINLDVPADIITCLVSPSNINDPNEHGLTALHMAVVKSRWDLVPILIRHGADINFVNDHEYVSLREGQTPFHCAVEKNAPKYIVDQLVSPDNINMRDIYGESALHRGVKDKFSASRVETLLQLGADVNVSNNETNPLLVSAIVYDAPLDSITQIISPKNINMQNKRGEAPLDWAVFQKKWDVVSVLLKHGADINISDDGKRTPLHRAACYGAPDDIFNQLISPCNINMQDEIGCTPLGWAAGQKFWNRVPVLLQHGADVNLGLSKPLHSASYHGAPADIIIQLISSHNINMLNGDGDTALHLAVNEKRWNLVPVLLQYGAEPSMLDSHQPHQALVFSLKALCISTIRSHMPVKSDAAYERLGLPSKLVAEAKLGPQAEDIVYRYS